MATTFVTPMVLKARKALRLINARLKKGDVKLAPGIPFDRHGMTVCAQAALVIAHNPEVDADTALHEDERTVVQILRGHGYTPTQIDQLELGFEDRSYSWNGKPQPNHPFFKLGRKLRLLAKSS
jgi:hypothetical protein